MVSAGLSAIRRPQLACALHNMMFWISVSSLAAAVVAVLAFGTRRAPADVDAGLPAAGMAIYKDQLAELERDVARGLVLPGEAEGQRAEIARRLLALGREAGQAKQASGAVGIPLVMALLVPMVAVPIYFAFGKPQLPDVPHAARLANAEKTGDMPALVARVEAHLKKNPGDVAGWKLLAPVYQGMGRFGDLAVATRMIMDISGETADLQAELAEALTLDNKGLMNDAAIAAATAAVRLDPKLPKARYYLALSQSQNGKTADALAGFKSLLADSPADAPWRDDVQREIDKIEKSGAAPQLSQDQMANAATMAPAERMVMIRTMVDGLDQKLAANGSDVEGWLRLIRARTVLQENEKAAEALAKARQVLKDDAQALSALDSLAKELQLP